MARSYDQDARLTVDSIAERPDATGAWFMDNEGNMIASSKPREGHVPWSRKTSRPFCALSNLPAGKGAQPSWKSLLPSAWRSTLGAISR